MIVANVNILICTFPFQGAHSPWLTALVRLRLRLTYLMAHLLQILLLIWLGEHSNNIVMKCMHSCFDITNCEDIMIDIDKTKHNF